MRTGPYRSVIYSDEHGCVARFQTYIDDSTGERKYWQTINRIEIVDEETCPCCEGSGTTTNGELPCECCDGRGTVQW